MRNVYSYEDEKLSVTKTESKTLNDVWRVVHAGKEKAIDKFIEMYLYTINENQIALDSWYDAHQRVVTGDPSETPVTVVEINDEGVETPVHLPTSYQLALSERNELESQHDWLQHYRGQNSEAPPEIIVTDEDIQTWKAQNVDYRTARFNDYVNISPEGKFEHTVGDFLDALVKAHYGDSGDLDLLAGKVSDIKSKHPKPE